MEKAEVRDMHQIPGIWDKVMSRHIGTSGTMSRQGLHTTLVSPIYVTQLRILRCMSQVAVGPPKGGSGTAHRWQWDCSQAAMGPPTGGSGTAHRRQ